MKYVWRLVYALLLGLTHHHSLVGIIVFTVLDELFGLLVARLALVLRVLPREWRPSMAGNAYEIIARPVATHLTSLIRHRWIESQLRFILVQWRRLGLWSLDDGKRFLKAWGLGLRLSSDLWPLDSKRHSLTGCSGWVVALWLCGCCSQEIVEGLQLLGLVRLIRTWCLLWRLRHHERAMVLWQ